MVVYSTSLFFSLFCHSFLSVSVCLSIDSLPNRQYDLDWTLMGGDFQFDPRLKRHRIFTVAATVLFSVSKQGKNSWASSNQKECKKYHLIQQHKASLAQKSLPHLFHSLLFIYRQYSKYRNYTSSIFCCLSVSVVQASRLNRGETAE